MTVIKTITEKYERPPNKDAVLILDDGSVFWGMGAGAKKSVTGELCFNTSLTGYQEVLTDPSYAGQIITFTFPHIGNVGTNEDDNESAKTAALGCILSADITEPSNWRSGLALKQWLKKNNLVAITGLDTRQITKKIRERGYATAAILYGKIDIEGALQEISQFSGIEGLDLAKEVSCKKPYDWTQGMWSGNKEYSNPQEQRYFVIAVDFGIKRNIARSLASAGCRLKIVPATTSASEIIALNPDGIFLSNGPGDPEATGKYAVPMIQKLIQGSIPIFGICLGHQMLALALGAKTKKMHHGHRGSNHPVKNLENSKIEITSQNHGFVVERSSLPSGVIETHKSLFDNTVEGIRVEGKRIFSVQYHPEASPGPQDSQYLFTKFIKDMEKNAETK
jgi:carbamoyl-phosphate synthase small subunit